MPTERSLPSRRASPVARPRRSMPRSRISRPIRGRFGRVMRSSGSCAGWPASTSRLCSGLARTRSSCAPSIAAPSAPDASGASSHGGSQTTRRVARCVPASTRATTLRRDARCACCCGYAIRVSPPRGARTSPRAPRLDHTAGPVPDARARGRTVLARRGAPRATRVCRPGRCPPCAPGQQRDRAAARAAGRTPSAARSETGGPLTP